VCILGAFIDVYNEERMPDSHYTTHAFQYNYKYVHTIYLFTDR